MKPCDIRDAEHPREVPEIIRNAAAFATKASHAAQSEWHDKRPARMWRVVAREMGRCADSIEKAFR